MTMLKSSKNLQYREPYMVNNAKVTLHESGHVVGGASIVVEHEGKKIFYSGDINTRGSKLLRPADLDFGEIDMMIIESTYSQSEQQPREEAEKELIEFAYEVIGRGGTLFIPSFSVERAQEIATVLKAYNFKHKVVMDGMALRGAMRHNFARRHAGRRLCNILHTADSQQREEWYCDGVIPR
jgi:putative mRNA 3-end processing factor